MNFLADEGIDRQVVETLRQEGHQVLYVAEMEPDISDEAVLRQANKRTVLWNRTLERLQRHFTRSS